jgi:GDP-L-fucose synthase
MSILITGGSGMVGTSFKELSHDIISVSSSDCDLRSLSQTKALFNTTSPDYVVHLAAKVGGVKANTDYMGDFYRDNLLINTNVLECSRMSGVKKVVSLLSTCVYPDKVLYPLTEEQIHDGPPHSSNFAYAYAKRMLDVQSRAYRKQYGCNFITAIPNNLYGPNDNFHLEDSHVIPAIIRKVWEAKLSQRPVVLWGDGTPLREFTYSKDIAEILLFLLKNYNDDHPVNIGKTGHIEIKKVAKIVCEFLDYNFNDIRWDSTKPSGQHKKPSSNKKLIHIGWDDKKYTSLRDGLKKTCDWFIINYPNVRGI